MDGMIYILDAQCKIRAWREMHPHRFDFIQYEKTPNGWEFVSLVPYHAASNELIESFLQRYRVRYYVRRSDGLLSLQGSQDLIVRRRIGTDQKQIEDFVRSDPTRAGAEMIKVSLEWPALER